MHKLCKYDIILNDVRKILTGKQINTADDAGHKCIMMLMFDRRKDEFMKGNFESSNRVLVDSVLMNQIPTEKGMFIERIEGIATKGKIQLVTNEDTIDIVGFQEDPEYFRFLAKAKNLSIEFECNNLNEMTNVGYVWMSAGGVRTLDMFGFESAVIGLPNFEKIYTISTIAEKYAIDRFMWLSDSTKYVFKERRADVIQKLQNFEGTDAEKNAILVQYVREYVQYVARMHNCDWILKPNGRIVKIVI